MGGQRSSAFIAILLGAVISGGISAQVPISGDPGIKPGAGFGPHRPLSQELTTSAGASLRVVAVGSLALCASGDSLRPFDPELLALLGGGVDARVANTATVGDLETSLIDASTFEGYPYPWGTAATPMALVSAATTFRPHSQALNAGSAPARPGISAMRLTRSIDLNELRSC
ncbi:MAG: hypothetical protein ABSH33_00570 [Steroidobacteraceae bacterium]|jgi:hypothetical protein